MGKVFTRQNADGFFEGVDEDTGDVIWTEKIPPHRKEIIKKSGRPPGRPRVNGPPETHHWLVDHEGNRLWVPKGTNADTLPRTVYPYSETVKEAICHEIIEGKTLAAVCRMEGFPTLRVVSSWLIKYPDFRADLKKARELRAEYHFDRALEIADQTDPDNASSDRLKVDTLKWAAAVDDPQIYSPRTKVSGDPDAPMGFVIATGVPAPEEKPAIESSCGPVGADHE